MRRGETPCPACRAANAAYGRKNRAEAEKREQQRKRRISGYGVIKETEVLSTLPVDEQVEYRRIQRRKHRSAAAEERMRELAHKAHQLHQERRTWTEENTPDTSWFEDLKTRMWAKALTHPARGNA